MKNFSIYELLSYLIPGFLFLKLLTYYLADFQLQSLSKFDGDLNNNIFFLVVSLVIGVALHRFTFIIKNWPLYRNDVYVSIDKLKEESEELKKLIPLVEDIMKTKIGESQFDKTYLFDIAYYYLEVNSKIGTSKSFQSFYFLFRNIYTVLLLTSPFLLIKLGTTFVNYQTTTSKETLTLVSVLLLFPISVWCARFMRRKMFERVFWSYYIDNIHKN